MPMTSTTPNSPLSAQATVAGDLRDGATLSGRAGPSEFALGGPEEYGHILVDTFGLLIACRVEPADISDRKAAARLLGGLRPLFPNIRTVIADAGLQSRRHGDHLLRQDGWKLQIVKRRQRAFKITGLTWIVERSFAWLR